MSRICGKQKNGCQCHVRNVFNILFEIGLYAVAMHTLFEISLVLYMLKLSAGQECSKDLPFICSCK